MTQRNYKKNDKYRYKMNFLAGQRDIYTGQKQSIKKSSSNNKSSGLQIMQFNSLKFSLIFRLLGTRAIQWESNK